MNRRAFLRTVASGATVAVSANTLSGALATPVAAASGGPLIPAAKTGIQLYSIRDQVARIGFRRVFEELSRIGYREVEFAGYTQGAVGPITVPEIRRLLDDNGLRAVGSHVGLSAFRANLELELDRAEILGTPYIGTANEPVTPDKRTVAGYREAAAEFNRFGAAAAGRCLKWYHHNHSDEFGFAADDPGVRLYDVLLAETDRRYVYLEMDIYWAYVGKHRFPGFEPIDYVKAQPHRYPLFHLKDGNANPANPNGYDIVEFGAGDLPFRSFLKSLQARGMHHGIWEQDNAPGALPDPPGSFGPAARSYRAIRELRG